MIIHRMKRLQSMNDILLAIHDDEINEPLPVAADDLFYVLLKYNAAMEQVYEITSNENGI